MKSQPFPFTVKVNRYNNLLLFTSPIEIDNVDASNIKIIIRDIIDRVSCLLKETCKKKYNKYIQSLFISFIFLVALQIAREYFLNILFIFNSFINEASVYFRPQLQL